MEKFIIDWQTRGMHIGTIRKVLVTLGQILGYAVRHKYLAHNSLKEVERPRCRSQDGHKKLKGVTAPTVTP